MPNWLRAIAPGPASTVYPNALPLFRCPPRADDEAIVFSGNLEYHPNRSAVRYFRREIWPLLRERWPELVWRLVGKNPEAVRAIHGRRPADRSNRAGGGCRCELARSRVAVVPLLAGSGRG